MRSQAGAQISANTNLFIFFKMSILFEYMKVCFLYNDIYRGSSFGNNHPVTNNRISNVYDLSKIINFQNVSYLKSKIATKKILKIFHDEAYINILKKTEKTQRVSLEDGKKYNIGNFSNPIFKEMYRRHAAATGSLIMASNLLLNSKFKYIFSPGSGAHHGKKNKASGFCYFNDITTCILYLKKNNIKKIVYFDMDAHYGDGVIEYFKNSNDILCISLHQKDLWPRNGHYMCNESVLNLPVNQGFDDKEFKDIFQNKIEKKIKEFNPEIALLQMGADCLFDDPMSKLCLTNNSMAYVIEKFKGLSKNLIVMGGGGYNPWTTLRAWILNLAVLAEETDKLELKADAIKFLGNIKWKKEPKSSWINNIRDKSNIYSNKTN